MMVSLEGLDDEFGSFKSMKRRAKRGLKTIRKNPLRAGAAIATGGASLTVDPKMYKRGAELLGKIRIKKLAKKAVSKNLKLVSKVANNPVLKAVASVYPPAAAALALADKATMLTQTATDVLKAATAKKGAPLTIAEQESVLKTQMLVKKAQNIKDSSSHLKTVKEKTGVSSDNAAIQAVKDDLRTRAEKYYDAGLLK